MTDETETDTGRVAPAFYWWYVVVGSIFSALSLFSLMVRIQTIGLTPIIQQVVQQYQTLSREFVSFLLGLINSVFPNVPIAVSDPTKDILILLTISTSVFARGLTPIFQQHGLRGLAILVSSIVLGVIQVLESAFTNWVIAASGEPSITPESVMISFIVAMPSAVILPAVGESVRYMVSGSYSEDAPIIFAMSRTYLLIAISAATAGILFVALNSQV